MSRSLLVLVAFASALPAWASDIGSVKCIGNQDRVWVYDSLSSFDVEAKLRCGETVEIVSRANGFVRIRTANGVDGYVPESVFPDLPPLEDKDKAPAGPAPRPAANAKPAVAAQPAPASATSTVHAAVPVSAPAVVTRPAAVKQAAAKESTLGGRSFSSDIRVAQGVSTPEVPTPTKPSASLSEPEDYAEAQPENESADPDCRVFFSAYGLAPAQYKWLVDNRRKQYASICPAPDLARVDYVIIFAHDSDSFVSSMPAPVHTDPNGFSDFSPITMMDTALMSRSELEKVRYEFVWVFQMKRGAFDPVRFSPRRRPQFNTDAKGSHASAKAIDDAFHFIEGQSPDR